MGGAPKQVSIVQMKVAILVACAMAAAASGQHSMVDYDIPEELLAPASAQAPEFVQMNAEMVSSTVDDLKKQFHELQQMAAQGTRTKGIKSTINNMINMITTQIQPAIRQAARADQSNIKAQANEIRVLNGASKEIKKALSDRAADVRGLIQSHNKDAASWFDWATNYLKAIKDYEKVVKRKTRACCLKQSAGVPRVEYTPSYVECDFTSSDANQCIARAESKLINAVQSYLKRGARRYKTWKGRCAKLTGRIPKFQKVMKGHHGKCTKFKVTAEIAAKQVKRDKPILLRDWAREKKKYVREYSRKRSDYRRAEERIKREEKIRFQEWDSTQVIKCMLRSYEKCKGGSSNCSGRLNRASMKRCTNKVKTQPKRKSLTIHYPGSPGRPKWHLGDFADLKDTSGFSKHCSRSEKADELADAPKRCRKRKDFHKQKPKPVCNVGGKKVKQAKVTPAKKINKKIRVPSPSLARRRRRTKVTKCRKLGKYKMVSYNYPGFSMDAINAHTAKISRQGEVFQLVRGLYRQGDAAHGRRGDQALHNKYRNCIVSFKTLSGKYLRHSGYALRVHSIHNSALFRLDASYYMIPNKYYPGTYVFQSVNYPKYMIRHANYVLSIGRMDGSTLFKKDASFKLKKPEPPARKKTQTKVNRCRASTSRKDAGYVDNSRGWYDASGCGRCYDYCRRVGNTPNPRRNPATMTRYGSSWWSCRKAGTSGSYTGKGAYGSRFKFRKCNGKGGKPLRRTFTAYRTRRRRFVRRVITRRRRYRSFGE